MPNIRRNAEGLTIRQRYFLTQLALKGSITEACKKTKVTRRTFYRWLKEPAFRGMYDGMFVSTPDDIRDLLAPSAERAVEVLNEALNAEDTLWVDIPCPHDDICDVGTHKISVSQKVWKVRMQAVNTLLKAKGVMVDRTEHKFEGEIRVVNLTLAENMALARLRAGFEIPQYLRDKFEQLMSEGQIPPLKQLVEGSVETVEGITREVTEDENPTRP